MTIQFSNVARISHALNNANSPLSTALIEIPTDIGRSYAGYKRGGIIEGAEKFRKEVMAAMVWLFGIPLIKKGADWVCENVLKIPMGIDYSNANEGNDAIGNCARYLMSDGKDKFGDFKDASELERYIKDGEFIYKDKFSNADELIKKIKGAKIATSITALVLNCLALGVILPLINQKLTKDKLDKENNKNQLDIEKTALKPLSLDEFKTKTKKPISFTGAGEKIMQGADIFVDLIENSSKFRLIAPDVPMISGRMATSRNKYEALEYLLIDGSGIYLYNFCNGNVQSLLRKLSKTINIDSTIAQSISELSEDELKSAIQKLNENQDVKSLIQNSKEKSKASFVLKELFGENKASEIYKQGTYGAYGKMSSYVKHSKINSIDLSVIKFLQKIKEVALTKDSAGNISIDISKVQQLTKSLGKKNLAFQIAGWAVSVFGLAIAAPKITYWITKKITGKDGFIALEKCDDDKK